MLKRNIYLYFIVLIALVHSQFNMHSFGLFLLVSAITALIPIPNMRWWKYSLLQLVALLFCLALNFPEAIVLETVGSILKTGGIGLIAATIVVSTITYTLVAWTVYSWITRFIFEKRLANIG